MRELIDRGHEVVLWTTRNGEELTAAVDWCGDRGLHFCNVNGPAPSNKEQYDGVYPVESRKIYADVYIDDHNLEFIDVGVGTGTDMMIKCIRRLKGRK